MKRFIRSFLLIFVLSAFFCIFATAADYSYEGNVIYLSDKYGTTPMTLASKRMLAAAGVSARPLETEREEITLSFVAD